MSGNFTGRGKAAARGSHTGSSGSTRPQRQGAGLGMYQAIDHYLTSKRAQSLDAELESTACFHSR